MKPEPKNLDSIEQLADRYADELSAQFRTLNLFVQHAGEVGRAHEVFLRGVLQRFLPESLRCASGFIASADLVTRQQDIIIFDAHSLPILLQIGDCVVVDNEAVAATIEVKTAIGSKAELLTSLEKIAELKRALRHSCALGLYAWEGLSLEHALSCVWERYRAQKDLGTGHLPDAIYVRGQYLIVPNYDGRLETAPVLVLRLGVGHHAEGTGLLSLVERLWIAGLNRQARAPWWIHAWQRRVSAKYEDVPWPDDLRARVDEQLAQIAAKAQTPPT
jgi:hypothetical protein